MSNPAGSAIIAGFGAGLGEATAQALVGEGLKVGLLARSRDKLESFAKPYGGDLLPIPADVTDPDAVDAAVGEVEDALGPIKCAIFNAGQFLKGSILEFPPSDFERAWRVGAFGGFIFGQAVAKRMVAREEGTIIFTGATASLRGNPMSYGFSSPKFALRSVAQSMARELGPRGIHVTHVVLDGAIEGPKYPPKEGDVQFMPKDLAQIYLNLHKQPRSTWTHELDVRPWCEPF